MPVSGSNEKGSGMSEDRQTERANSNVDHPAHYNWHPVIECIDVVEEFTSPNIASAIEYLWRAGRKGDAIEDLKKAAWRINREIERLKRKQKTSEMPK